MKTGLWILAVLFIGVSCAEAAAVGSAVEVSIVTDQGQSLSLYPATAARGLKKVYAEAVRGDYYVIVVANRLDRRVGVVIAVDGRNIISGQKSWLANTERMYILEPHSRYEYSGWRTAQDRVNRFYFTDAPDSYAAAFGDESAMGVIAVAAYPEVRRREPPAGLSAPLERSKAGSARDAAPSAESQAAGTGYGHEEHSPSYLVRFDPEKKAVETILIKYEWRESLCKIGIIRCGTHYGKTYNRLWDDYGYAPPPPGRR
ncbi:MAG TPA: hypothetical protein VMB77_04205 [Syntrophales bacterium]|nr:hypothetical protein [Syntrophales bacterium]